MDGGVFIQIVPLANLIFGCYQREVRDGVEVVDTIVQILTLIASITMVIVLE